jgi:long-subunit fatty acid transport protein
VYNDEPVLQPSLSVSKGGFYLSVWSDMDLTDRNDHAGDFSEVDFVASYTREFKWVGLELGLAEYLYPHQTLETEAEAEEGEGAEAEGAERRTTGEAYPGTREVYLNTTLTFGEFPIAPALSLNYDFDEADGFYGAAGLTYNQEFLNERLQVEASVTVGWGSKKYNAYYFEVEDGAFNDCTVSLGAGYELSDRWTVTPSLQYGVLLDGDLRTAAKEGDLGHAELLVGSLNVSYTF